MQPVSPWFKRLSHAEHGTNGRPAPAVRLFCFAYAGGGASIFRRWPAYFGPQVELWAIQMPGREERRRDPLCTDMAEAVRALHSGMPATDGVPVVFFGHSMGALIGFELARVLAAEGREPQLLVAAGHRAPQLPDPHPPISHLPDPAFVDALDEQYGGIPPAVRAHEELLALFLPQLRADVALYENYRFQPGPPLTCPMLVMGGLYDEATPRHALQGWRQHTQGSFELHLFPAGHFFVQEQEEQVLQVTAGALKRLSPSLS